MKILLYGNSSPGYINRYNIAQLITNYPDIEFKMVAVESHAVPKRNILMRFASRLKNGRNLMMEDQQVLQKHFLANIKSGVFNKLPIEYVKKVNDEDSVKAIRNFDPDIILQCGAGILKKNIFNLAKIGTINVHHGLAPEIRGIMSNFWCLYYGLHDKIGVTVHFIDRGLDTGTIIHQYNYPFIPGDDYINLTKTVVEMGARLLIKAIGTLQKEFEVVEVGEVRSYYFSKVDFRLYNKLKKNNFLPIANSGNLPYKIMKKLCISPRRSGTKTGYQRSDH